LKDKKTTELYNVNNCPLCNGDNACANIGFNEENTDTATKNSCWCMNPAITFSEALLQKIPAEAKNKSCICQACALAHQMIQ
jgi:hypothetical protein